MKRILVVLPAGLFLLIIASLSAFRSYNQPFPSLFLDPFGVFSVVYLPDWGTSYLGVLHSDKLINVNSLEITTQPEFLKFPISQISHVIDSLQKNGTNKVRLTFLRNKLTFTIESPVRNIGQAEIVLLFIFYLLIALLTCWAALVVYHIAPSNSGKSSYIFVSIAVIVFLITFFDYHTKAWLAPLFSIATVCLPAGLLWFAVSFPQPLKSNRYIQYIGRVCLVIFIVLFSLILAVLPQVGIDPWWGRKLMDFLIIISLLFLSLMFIGRLFFGSANTRLQLTPVVPGLIIGPVVYAVMFAVSLISGDPHINLFLPLLPCIAIVTIGYGIIKRNLLFSNSIIPQKLFIPPLIISALCGGIFFGEIAYLSSISNGNPVGATVYGLLVFIILIITGNQLLKKQVFSASFAFNPVVVKLGDILSKAENLEVVKTALHKAVQQCFDSVVFNIDLFELNVVQPIESDSSQQYFVDEALQIHFPVKTATQLFGFIRIAQKGRGGLYTNEDVTLLETIACLGAISLSNIRHIEEINRINLNDIQSVEKSEAFSIETLGAEVIHETGYSINFFRFLLEQITRGKTIQSEDVLLGKSEVERMERIMKSLRQLRRVPSEKVPVNIADEINNAMRLLRDLIEKNKTVINIQIPVHLAILSERDLLVQLFANLLRNAIQAAGIDGVLDIIYIETMECTSIQFWDSGPGIPEHIRKDLFNPWVTSKPNGTGLGLVVCQRIVRLFGWTIAISRCNDKTCFSINMPKSIQETI